MEVPIPWEIRPPHLFSLNDITAKPIIWAQHPASAAPPASPVRENAAHIAADDIGKVRAMPTSTETMIPIKKGCSSVAHMINSPTLSAPAPIGGAISQASPTPTPIVTMGVTMISTFVAFDTIFPASAATMAMTSTARGPPAPPKVFAANPAVIRENRTNGGDFRA